MKKKVHRCSVAVANTLPLLRSTNEPTSRRNQILKKKDEKGTQKYVQTKYVQTGVLPSQVVNVFLII
jgi:hypothetical protein